MYIYYISIYVYPLYPILSIIIISLFYLHSCPRVQWFPLGGPGPSALGNSPQPPRRPLACLNNDEPMEFMGCPLPSGND